MTDRLAVLKTTLWALVGVLASITVVRFTWGLGSVTNLSDATPWGLWVGFDVMAGVALAAGGFVLAATVYIFRLERYRPFVRPAILTAFLGYVAVAVGLLYDLGLPWHIWHPAIYPQHHSVLFEVAMCVMLYLAVLALEFAPAVLEHPWFRSRAFQRAHTVFRRMTLPLVIAGIVLSTLHQSSLGSLFLITPYRLHALWYSPIIYVLFFVSAVGLGLMTVVLESLLAGYFLRHRIPTGLLSGLGGAAAGVLGLYVVLRVTDLVARGVLPSALDGSWQSFLFVFELGIAAVLPATLLLFRRVRTSVAGLAVSAGLVVSGFILNRLDVCFVAFARPEGAGYFPSWMEIAVSLGIVASGTLVFLFVVEHFRVYADDEHVPAPPTQRADHRALASLLPAGVAGPRRNTMAAVTAAALAFVFLPVRAPTPRTTPVTSPRTLFGESLERPEGGGHTLVLLPSDDDTSASTVLTVIDGNRDGMLVLFDHDGHITRLGADSSCGVCHHLNLPFDQASSCSECHRDMYESTLLFDHASHVRSVADRDGCMECHASEEPIKTIETATPCTTCHRQQIAMGGVIEQPGERWSEAVGYVEAMHGLCVTCHERSLDEAPERYSPDLGECRYCHDADRARQLDRLMPRRPSSRGPASLATHLTGGGSAPPAAHRTEGTR